MDWLTKFFGSKAKGWYEIFSPFRFREYRKRFLLLGGYLFTLETTWNGKHTNILFEPMRLYNIIRKIEWKI